MTITNDADATFAQWCIVELLGHRRLAGHVREVQIAGAGFLRLDIPETKGHAAQTQLIAPGSVYALHPVGEATARVVAAHTRPEPVHRWELSALTQDRPDPRDVAASFDDEGADEAEDDRSAVSGFDPDEPDDEDVDDGEHGDPCAVEYERPGGREPGDRIVRCGKPAGHGGEHEEIDTGSTWPQVTS